VSEVPNKKSQETLAPALEYRLATIEALLRELIDTTRGTLRKKQKRARAAAHSAYVSVVSDPDFKPTELQIAAARRALRRSGSKR
jgi:hypothetical protein